MNDKIESSNYITCSESASDSAGFIATETDLSASGTFDIDTITISNLTSGQFTLPSSYQNYTINTMGSGGTITSGFNGTTWGTPNSSLDVAGDANFQGDVKVKGHSLLHLMKKMEDRLAILQEPDPQKLEKFAALKKAYDHYKTLERLIGDD